MSKIDELSEQISKLHLEKMRIIQEERAKKNKEKIGKYFSHFADVSNKYTQYTCITSIDDWGYSEGWYFRIFNENGAILIAGLERPENLTDFEYALNDNANEISEIDFHTVWNACQSRINKL